MRHTGAYRMGTRTLALLMALLMMLTTGGFTLRDSAEPVADPVAEVTAEPVSDPAPVEPAPAEPAPETPVPAEPAPETPVPETEATAEPAPETPVPETEATAEPAPETPVPETEATAEPVPAEPQGDDTQMGGAEPAPADPTVEAPAEPTATPEPTADPNAGIMTVAESGAKIVLSLDGPTELPTEGNATYTLTIENQGPEDLTSSGDAYELEFIDKGNSADYKGNSRAAVTKVEPSDNITSGQHKATWNVASGTVILAAGAKVTISLSVPVVADSADLSFGVKIKGFLGRDGQSIRYQQTSTGITATHTNGITADNLTNTTNGTGGGTTTPDPDTGDDTTSGLVYHLNLPDSGEDYTVAGTPTTEGGTTYQVKDITIFNNQDIANLETAKGGHYTKSDYYFVGWSDEQSPASSYMDVDYRFENYDNGTFPNSLTVEVPTGETKELYGVWTTNSAVLGYTLTVNGADFIDGTNSVDKEGSTGDQTLAFNGTMSSGAPKYVVINQNIVFDYLFISSHKPV